MRLIRILSVQQWLKNGLILIPALFAASEWGVDLIIDLLIAIFGFSLLTSAIYINNDLVDLEADRAHPVKRNRMIASGQLKPNNARIIASLSFGAGMSLLLLLTWNVAIAGLVYVILNLLYSSYGKHIPIVDLLFISVGYVIRLLIGGFVASAPLSIWVISVVCMLAFYLVLLKRYGDVSLYRETGVLARKTVLFYTRFNLERIAIVFIHLITVVFLTYIFFVFGKANGPYAYLAFTTVPLAYFALVRYNQKALRNAQQDPINILLTDWIAVTLLLLSFFILTIALYIV